MTALCLLNRERRAGARVGYHTKTDIPNYWSRAD
jgi:hypothetical protein